ncbi:tyrosine aminotransferase-like [Ylistrum balloti]|uniref:tyrosine aminotransferase-like n=1 Tax=Ylistrum balloti TaxID=509963 RepID=UPI002905F3EC|nr:tyrosine aminotransferase-like [Ylistrum balloti]
MEPAAKRRRKNWNIPVSTIAKNTFNPIRSIVDSMKITPNPEKDMIALSIGDPTVFGNLPLDKNIEDAVIKSVKAGKYNGYNPSVGYEDSRAAVAEYSSTDEVLVTSKDVILTNGCSSALEMCITVLANAGDNILLPRPGFSIYKTLAEAIGIEVRLYNLQPEKSWEIDLDHLRSLVDGNTAAILVNSPSNPCGSVYSRKHILEILAVAEKCHLPIISDEIYEHFVFSTSTYHSLGSLSKNVPILSCSGLTKRFLVPGWRLGWIIIHDRNDLFKAVRKGLLSLSQRILGPNSLVQAAVTDILTKTPQEFFDNTVGYVESNAELFYNKVSKIPGLEPVKPDGAMYMMIGINKDNFPGVTNDIDFTEKMVKEQSVFCLPGQCFQYPNFFRVVLTIPTEKLEEACQRITAFCKDHYKPAGKSRGRSKR